jgi:hypothetical protein
VCNHASGQALVTTNLIVDHPGDVPDRPGASRQRRTGGSVRRGILTCEQGSSVVRGSKRLPRPFPERGSAPRTSSRTNESTAVFTVSAAAPAASGSWPAAAPASHR